MLRGSDQEAALAACDAIEEIARRGDGWNDDAPAMKRLRAIRSTRSTAAALEGVRWAFDSMGAAQASSDFPVDATVAASARRCFAAICADPRVVSLQVAVILRADIDQIAFACNEISVNTYGPLTDHVFGRLAPCHELTLIAPRPTPEECAR